MREAKRWLSGTGVTEDTHEVMEGRAQGETRAQAWRDKQDFIQEARQRQAFLSHGRVKKPDTLS